MGAEVSQIESVDELSDYLIALEKEILKEAYNSPKGLILSFGELQKRCMDSYGKNPLKGLDKSVAAEYANNVGDGIDYETKQKQCEVIAEYHQKRILIIVLSKTIRDMLKEYETAANAPEVKSILKSVTSILRQVGVKKATSADMIDLDDFLSQLKSIYNTQVKQICRDNKGCLDAHYKKYKETFEFEESKSKLRKDAYGFYSK